jgi:hypothetical protein
MAGKITRRTWTGRGPTGRKIKKVAFGFTVTEGGRRIRKYDAGWSREDAEKALAAYQLGVKDVSLGGPSLTFGEAITRYLEAKAKKQSLRDDRHRLDRLKSAFGASTPLSAITASKISEYKVTRLKGHNPAGWRGMPDRAGHAQPRVRGPALSAPHGVQRVGDHPEGAAHPPGA